MTIPSDLTWTPHQQIALTLCAKFLKDPAQQVFRLFGYAGTGKTTLAQHLAAQQDGLVLFAAYTGKAASVMRAAGCTGASTLHSLLYLPSEGSRAEVERLEALLRTAPGHEVPELQYDLRQARIKSHRPQFTLNSASALATANLLVVDEVSMVDARMKADILSFGKKVLVLGDPAQLPPVSGEGGAFTSERPHWLMEQIRRQALDNPIIRWATAVREGHTLPFATEGPCRKVRKTSISAADLVHRGGQLLTGKNDTRRTLNQQARRLMGVAGPYPQKGEPLVCLQNDHSVGFLNGVTCVAASDAELMEDVLIMDILYEGRVLNDVEVSPVPFDMYQDAEAEAEEPSWARRQYQRFDYGYCLTVHKAQGSQWPRVTVCDDGFAKRSPTDRRRWLYTAITRAQTELEIVA